MPAPAALGRHGKYRVLAVLGSGGFADVYLTLLRGPAFVQKLVVVKRLKSDLVLDPASLIMFADEARLAVRLSHPNVVVTHEVVEDAHECFIAMEYLEGQTLNQVFADAVHRSAPFDPVVPCRIASEALAGLHYAHELRALDGTPLLVVHRDVSPHNVLVTYEGHVKVMDFGLAKAAGNLAETAAGLVKGKLAYMAPEQMRGLKIDRRSDVFAIGAVLWELLTLQRMRLASDELRRVAREPPPRMSQVCPGIDPRLDGIVARALQVEPDARYATAKEMRDALESYIDSTGRFLRDEDVGATLEAGFGEKRRKQQALVQARVRAMLAEESGHSAGGVLARAVASKKSVPPPPAASSEGASPFVRQVEEVRAPIAPRVPLPPLPVPQPLSLRQPVSWSRRAGVGAAGAGALVAAVGLAFAGARFLRMEEEGAMGASTAGGGGKAAVVSGAGGTEAGTATVTVAATATVTGTGTRPGTGTGMETGTGSGEGGSACPSEMAHIPGGRFTMGSNEPPSARPAHTVSLAAFCFDTFEVTVDDYLACDEKADAGRVECPPAPLENRGETLTPAAKALLDPFCNARDPARHAQHPINCVDWTSARLYCDARGKRLPSEAEWELAARGADGRVYPWGNGGPTSALVNACDVKCELWKRENAAKLRTVPEALPLVGIYGGDDGSLGTAAVGSFPKGASPYAVEDLAGNVAEWVADELTHYPAGYPPAAAPPPKVALPNAVRVVRGGSWVSGREIQVTALIRRGLPAGTMSAFVGFRCARSLEPSPSTSAREAQ